MKTPDGREDFDIYWDARPKLVKYLKDNFNDVATSMFFEPFSNKWGEPNGITINLNREPTETEKPLMFTEYDGLKVRWGTPAQRFELPKEEPVTLSVKLEQVKPK